MIVALAEARVGYGNKAAGLARVQRTVPVPTGWAIPAAWIIQHLSEETRTELTELLARAEESDYGRIVELTGGLPLPAAARAELTALVTAGRWAVRSSSSDEDAESLSFAGVFDSLLGVTPTELADAVLAVWRSGFTPRALLAFDRAGVTPRLDHMNVLIQQQIEPATAGVAFTGGPDENVVEWVPGSGREVVDGSVTPTREQLTPTDPGWRGELATQLAVLPDSDIEWAYDGKQIWIVQVRPRTAELPTTSASGLRAVPLYEGDPSGFELAGIEREYHRIRAKRRVPRAIALSQGARVPAGWLVNWQVGSDELAQWSSTLPAEVVLDASSTERQHILPRSELADAMTRLVHPTTGTAAFLCREYLKGDMALLSTVDPAGAVYVEASPEGLLALNRGFGSARALDHDGLLELVGSAQADALARTTRQHAEQLHPRATLEWVVQQNTLYFVDYSAPVGTEPATHALGDGRVLSAGIARGEVQRLDVDELLTESSVAPIISISEQVSPEHQVDLLGQLRARLDLDRTEHGIIVAAPRPIAILSMLIGIVDGFLFEEGALLSHLGILLREAGVPAAIIGTGNLPRTGAHVELVHGAVIELDELRPR